MRGGVNLAAINKLSDYTFMEYFALRRDAGFARRVYTGGLVFYALLKCSNRGLFYKTIVLVLLSYSVK